MTTLYIGANTQACSSPWAHKLGDTLCAIHNSWEWFRTFRPERTLVSLCQDEIWNPLWARFVRETGACVLWDPPVGEKARCYEVFDERRRSRSVQGTAFDIYRELYCRLDGGPRQHALAGAERGLNRRSIWEYFWWGQEDPTGDPPESLNVYRPGEIDVPALDRQRRVLIGPVAVCQGNRTFSGEFWRSVAHRLVKRDVPVTWNDVGSPPIEHPLVSQGYATPRSIAGYVASHALVAAGNTGLGWVAAATGTPLIACEPHDSYMQDFRYERCGVESLVRVVPEPNAEGMAQMIVRHLDGVTSDSPELEREPFLMPYLDRVRDFRVAIDVGAATGEWLQMLAPRFDYVYAIEPDPTNRAAIAGLGLPNVTVCPYAAWSNDCELTFNRYENPHIGSVAERDMRRGNGAVEILRVTGLALDSQPFPVAGLIKIDVEGSEVLALIGCTHMIEAWHPVLVVECHEPENLAWADTWLRRAGYRCEVVAEPGRKGFPEWLVADWHG